LRRVDDADDVSGLVKGKGNTIPIPPCRFEAGMDWGVGLVGEPTDQVAPALRIVEE
jgi:hypothetical protein